MAILKEFKDFISRGNVIDLAVGVIIGAAFGKIVTALVEDILMPPIGAAFGKLDFSNYYLPLSSAIPKGLDLVAARKVGPVLAYGDFASILINFLIVSACIFMVIKGVNTLQRQKTAAAPAPAPAPDPADVVLLREIRDLLKSGRS